MRRILQTAFSVFLIIAGGYFLSLFLQHPTRGAMLTNGVPALFWVCLGGFLLWNDFLRRRRTKEK